MPKSITTNFSRQDGFTLTELLIATTIMLLLLGGALATFQNAVMVTDAGTQLADANQNLRAGTNQLIRDVMEAGRLVGSEGIPIPAGAGTVAIMRPAPPGTTLSFDVSSTTNMPDITTGYQLGPTINGSATDMITLIMVDSFMPTIQTPPTGTVDPNEGTMANDGSFVTLPTASLWLVGDTTNDTPAAQIGDLVYFQNVHGTAVQTITGKDATHLYFAANDDFHFNQRTATQGSVVQIEDPANPSGTPPTNTATFPATALYRLLMITYYVDNTTVPGSPRLMRKINNYAPLSLAGVVEDLDLTYDLVDGVNNPAGITSLPYHDGATNTDYNSNQIRKVNLHVGVRSENISRPVGDYIRNHLSTSVDARSLASVPRYVEQ
jgi:prepilin-type N-terminal cleavage/methylation domain-containing protein